MSPKYKYLVAVFVIVILAVGALTALAQDDTTTVPSFGPGMMMGRGGWGYGMMGRGGFGPGMMWADDAEPMIVTIANALGIDQTALVTELRSGKTLAEIAEAQGVDIQVVYDAMLAQMEEHMAAQVAAGYLTQEQADAHLAYMQQNIATMPMFGGAGFGPCWNSDGGYAPGGMMGRPGMRGRGMGWTS